MLDYKKIDEHREEVLAQQEEHRLPRVLPFEEPFFAGTAGGAASALGSLFLGIFRVTLGNRGKERKGKETGKYVIVDNSFGIIKFSEDGISPASPP